MTGASVHPPVSISPQDLNRMKDVVRKQSIQKFDGTGNDEDDARIVEEFISLKANESFKKKDAAGLKLLQEKSASMYEFLGRPRASKLVRLCIEYRLQIADNPAEKVKLMVESLDWAEKNGRQYLTRTLKARLIKLNNEIGRYSEAMKMASELIPALKKLEDRELTMEVSLEDSRAAYYLNNHAKARTALVLAKTSSQGSYVSVPMQAALDLQSGILYSADERDFRTAYSYFFEALEAYVQLKDDVNTRRALKYMCLCKIMLDQVVEITPLLATKTLVAVKGPAVDAITELAQAFKERSLAKFQKCLEKHAAELLEDKVIGVHSKQLNRTMIEKEITRVIQPYSEVDLAYIIKKVGLSRERIEKAISRMLLDKVIYGCIDQHAETLVVYPPPGKHRNYEKAVGFVKNLNKVVDAAQTVSAKLVK